MLEDTKKKIILTGSESMVGRAIYDSLKNNYEIFRVSHKEYELLDCLDVHRAFSSDKYDYAILCAGYNGNIAFNAKHPAEIFAYTTQIGLHSLSACVKYKIPKVISMISSCAYPDNGQEILRERDFWNGEPNPTVDAHGFAKRTLMEYGRQIYKQYGTIHVGMVVNTVYGPYDNYDINKTKVVGGLIKKFVDAKNNDENVVCWGTGRPRREFIFSEDVGKYTKLVLENYDNTDYPINIGSGIDFSIRELVYIIAEEVNFKNKIVWDTSKPDGQMKKLLDNTMMKQYFGDLQFTGLKDGLRKTINWYENFYNSTVN